MNLDSLHAQYLLERRDLQVLQKEHGFIAFKLTPTECFIGEMFVSKENREAGLGRAMIQEVAHIAELNGCTLLTANIHTSDPNCTGTLAASIATGFTVRGAGNGILLISMDLKGAK